MHQGTDRLVRTLASLDKPHPDSLCPIPCNFRICMPLTQGYIPRNLPGYSQGRGTRGKAHNFKYAHTKGV